MTSLTLASLDNLTIGYIVTDIDRRVQLINYAARALLTTTKQIATLEEVVAYLPDRLALLDHVKYCSIEHKSCGFRQVELGDRLVKVFLSPIFEDGKLQGNLLTLEDITDKVQNEKARDQFLSFLVHEFRTPLTAIRGNSTIIKSYFKDELKNPQLKEIVVDIASGSEYMLGMVNQFLDMARLEEGRIEYEMEPFEAGELIEKTVGNLEVLAKERGLTLRHTLPKKADFEVVADQQRTQQVLTNLIGNGLKFTETGGVTVSAEASADHLKISVADTGPGIPQESRAGMFQKFFQASNNKYRKDSAKSTGLGLYATRLMVEGMGGTIALAASETGKGSTFEFTLDLATPARLKRLEKSAYDAKQGVEHAQAEEHHSIALRSTE